jgi:outer membrane protein
MGIDVLIRYEVAPAPETSVTPLTAEQLVELGRQHRPGLLAARAEVEAARAGFSAAKKGQLPSVDLSASLGWRDQDFPASRQYWNLGIGLSMDLFDADLTRGRRKQAQAQRDAALDNVTLLEQQVAQETVQDYYDLRTAEQQILSAQAGVTSADEDWRLAQGRYAEEVGILLELLDAQTALTSAQVQLAQARFTLTTARHALERAIGMSLAEAAAAPAP